MLKLSGLESIENRKVRIFKFDRSTSIRNFIYSSGKSSQINVIRPRPWYHSGYRPYALLADGSIKENAFFNPPFGSKMSISEYAVGFKHALVKNQLHLFGGRNNKVKQKLKSEELESYRLRDLMDVNSQNCLHSFIIRIRTILQFYQYQEAEKVKYVDYYFNKITFLAIICFDDDSERKCELFDGFTVSLTFPTTSPHQMGELALYNGRPTAIGGGLAKAAVETLTNSGWIFLQDHPR